MNESNSNFEIKTQAPNCSLDGSLAEFYEWDSLDSCFGHSANQANYHYHATPTCIANANNVASCIQLASALRRVRAAF